MMASTTNRDPDCAWVRDHIEIHALGALAQDESARMESHLLMCENCDRLFSQSGAFLPLLGLAVTDHRPSRSVRESLLATAHADLADAGRSQPALESDKQPGRTLPFWHNFRLPHVLSAPTIGVLLLIAALTLGSQYQLGNQRDRVSALERENAGLATHLNSIREGQATFGENATVYALRALDETNMATGIVLASPSQSTALISVWNMPESDQTFRVIGESDVHGLVSLGEFRIQSGGVGSIQVTMPATVGEFSAVHIVTGAETGGINPATSEIEILRADLNQPTHEPTSES